MNCLNCPHCSSPATTQLVRNTSLGYKLFRCKNCHRTSNERTATPYNFLQFPTDIVLRQLRHTYRGDVGAPWEFGAMSGDHA
jgi:transposase-like protein